jgi:hypothetical protein
VLNAFLAVFWLLTGACFFFFVEREHPKAGSLPYPMTALTLVLAVYNVLRCWASRLTGGRSGGTPRRDWVRPPLRRPGDEVITPDPTFNFTDEPAPKADQAPGTNGSAGTEKQ